MNSSFNQSAAMFMVNLVHSFFETVKYDSYCIWQH